jgi:hypothetical protein
MKSRSQRQQARKKSNSTSVERGISKSQSTETAVSSALTVKQETWAYLGSLVERKARQSKCGFHEYIRRYIIRVESLMNQRQSFDIQDTMTSELTPGLAAIGGNYIVETALAPEVADVKMEEEGTSSYGLGATLKRGRGRPRKDSLPTSTSQSAKITSYFGKLPPSEKNDVVIKDDKYFPDNT